MDFATTPRGELVDIIYKQQREIEILKEVVAGLQEKLKQREPGDDSSKTFPGFVKTNVKKKKRKRLKRNASQAFQGNGKNQQAPFFILSHSARHAIHPIWDSLK